MLMVTSVIFFLLLQFIMHILKEYLYCWTGKISKLIVQDKLRRWGKGGNYFKSERIKGK